MHYKTQRVLRHGLMCGHMLARLRAYAHFRSPKQHQEQPAVNLRQMGEQLCAHLGVAWASFMSKRREGRGPRAAVGIQNMEPQDQQARAACMPEAAARRLVHIAGAWPPKPQTPCQHINTYPRYAATANTLQIPPASSSDPPIFLLPPLLACFAHVLPLTELLEAYRVQGSHWLAQVPACRFQRRDTALTTKAQKISCTLGVRAVLCPCCEDPVQSLSV